jgi:hypothetical protein
MASADTPRRSFWERLLTIDRRWIYVVLFLVVLAPFLLNWKPPVGPPNRWTEKLYQEIDSLPPGSVVMISVDYQPSGKPELQPMIVALARHALSRDLRLIMVSVVFPQGPSLAQEALELAAADTGAVDGVDYVNLGWRPQPTAVMLGMGEDIKEVFETDLAGRPTNSLEVMRGVDSYDDVGVLVTVSGTGIVGSWIVLVQQKFKVKLAAGVTSVSATDYYQYLRTEQLIGMINGLKGAAEYEYLAGYPDRAALGLPGVTAAHLLIVLLVILGNIGYFAMRGGVGRRR